MNPTSEPREERVAQLARTLEWASGITKACDLYVSRAKLGPCTTDAHHAGRALLTTVEALAGCKVEDLEGYEFCAECGELEPQHHETCLHGISAEAWRRFTQRGEHDAG